MNNHPNYLEESATPLFVYTLLMVVPQLIFGMAKTFSITVALLTITIFVALIIGKEYLRSHHRLFWNRIRIILLAILMLSLQGVVFLNARLQEAGGFNYIAALIVTAVVFIAGCVAFVAICSYLDDEIDNDDESDRFPLPGNEA